MPATFSTKIGLAPSDRICSLVAERTSVALTCAPSRRAVAIACKPGDADAHHEHLGRADRAGRGHHHRKGAAIGVGGLDHRLVAGEVRLRRQHVHRLGAGDARHPLHRQRFEPGLGVSRRSRRARRADRARRPATRPSSRPVQRRRVGPEHAQDDRSASLSTSARDPIGRARRFEFRVGDRRRARPRPRSTATLAPSAMNFFTVSGIAATRVSPAPPSLRTAIFMSRSARQLTMMSRTTSADHEGRDRAIFEQPGEARDNCARAPEIHLGAIGWLRARGHARSPDFGGDCVRSAS